MQQRRLIVAALALALAPRIARADHDMTDMHDMSNMPGMAMPATAPAMPPFSAMLQLVAASYHQRYFGGDYEGLVPSVMWMHGRWMAGASIGLYRVLENGVAVYGPGDVMIHGSFTILKRAQLQAGVALMVSAPSGNMYQSLGMGVPMLMPNGWATWTIRRVTLSGSVGWGIALGGDADMIMTVIVDPMNASEFEWSAGADVAIGKGVHAGAHLEGGVPVGEPGIDRVIGAVRAGWGTRRIDTAAEIQLGIAGDPFTVRGLVETALHF